jgi:hypothetical protein
MNNLKKNGYVDTVRTHYGTCITVLKAKKRFKKDAPITTHQSSNNDTSILRSRHISPPIMTHQSSTFESSNIDSISIDNTGDTTLGAPGAPREFSDQLKNNDLPKNDGIEISSAPQKNGIEISPGTGIFIHPKKEGEKINDAISLFLPILPGDFVGPNNAFNKIPTREAVGYLLERYTLSEIKDIIQKYDLHKKKGTNYLPSAYNVFEFCTSKLSGIEGFLAKRENKSDDIWERRSISTPEQRADSDAQIARILEKSREKSRKMKEEWLKTHPK